MMGEKWKSECEFYDYNSKNPLKDKEKLNIIKDHAHNDVIKEAVVYKTPLKVAESFPKAESIFFHAYLVYRACKKENQTLCNWWSAEKLSTGYELQRSEYLSDVVTKTKNRYRVGVTHVVSSEEIPSKPLPLKDITTGSMAAVANAGIDLRSIGSFFKKKFEEFLSTYYWLINKEEPQVSRQDRCKTGTTPATLFKIMKEKDAYEFNERNCKDFAMSVFNEISECKEWRRFAP